MGEFDCFLITILYRGKLLRCAMKVKRSRFAYEHQDLNWQDPKNWWLLHDLLPLHVQSCGPIVAVDTSLFEVSIVT